MKARVNTHALSATRFDSAALGVLGTIAHKLEKPGRYRLQAWRGEAPAGELEFTVDDDSEAAQLDIDLARMGRAPRDPGCDCGRKPAAEPPMLRSGGYLVLFVSEGEGRYRVTLDLMGTEKPQRVFDSRKLGKGDLFVVTLIRPGEYAAMEGSGGKASVQVAYPQTGKTAFRPPEPVTVTVAKGRMEPEKVPLMPGQGLVFAVEMEGAAIALTLAQPRDSAGPAPKGVMRRVRWTRPGGPPARR